MQAETSAGMLRGMALRCLIVDDNKRFLVAAIELLEREGIEVVGVASTSAEALQRREELRPDVTLVDIDLGAESGFDVVRQLANHSSPPGARVILISTYAERDFADLIEASPAIGFISKLELSGQAIHALLEGDSDTER